MPPARAEPRPPPRGGAPPAHPEGAALSGLRRQADAGDRTARDLVEGLGLRAARAPGQRPRVAAARTAAADGRAPIQGRSVALGHPADRALLRELRTGADAILVGAATMAAE